MADPMEARAEAMLRLERIPMGYTPLLVTFAREEIARKLEEVADEIERSATGEGGAIRTAVCQVIGRSLRMEALNVRGGK